MNKLCTGKGNSHIYRFVNKLCTGKGNSHIYRFVNKLCTGKGNSHIYRFVNKLCTGKGNSHIYRFVNKLCTLYRQGEQMLFPTLTSITTALSGGCFLTPLSSVDQLSFHARWQYHPIAAPVTRSHVSSRGGRRFGRVRTASDTEQTNTECGGRTWRARDGKEGLLCLRKTQRL